MPNAAPNYRWDHIHLRSPDPDATAAWFERILGAQVIRSTVEGKPRIDLKLGGADVFIMPVAPGDNVNPPTKLKPRSSGRVMVQDTPSPHDTSAGSRTIRPGLRICFLRGPQGISIELLERDQKYA